MSFWFANAILPHFDLRRNAAYSFKSFRLERWLWFSLSLFLFLHTVHLPSVGLDSIISVDEKGRTYDRS